MRSTFTQILLIAIIFLCASCGPYSRIPYFQDLDHQKKTEEEITNYNTLKIQVGDQLGINVNSLNPEATALFNSNLSRVTGNTEGGNNTNRPNTRLGADGSNTNPVFGYKVTSKGEIELPYLGKMKVSGLTTDELAEKLTKDLEAYAKKPMVTVRILNFKISVLGDVLRPDVYNVQNERITIMEALGLAGDLNITGKRKTVMLIREYDGTRQYFPVDLTSKKLFNSPYYYLQNNDVIVVDPDRIKYAPYDRAYRFASLVFTGISAAAIIFSAYLINNNQ